MIDISQLEYTTAKCAADLQPHIVTGPVPLTVVSTDVQLAGEAIHHLYTKFSHPGMTEESRQATLRLAVEVWREVTSRRPASSLVAAAQIHPLTYSAMGSASGPDIPLHVTGSSLS